MNKFFSLSLLVLSSISLSACIGGSAGAIGMAAGQGVASHAVKGQLYKNSARNMSCEEIEEDIAARKRGMINPLAIPDIKVQVASVQEVAREKGCPDYETTVESTSGEEVVTEAQ